MRDSYEDAPGQAREAGLHRLGRRCGMRLRVNPIACTGHGMCAELLPELIKLDPWGYPLLAADTRVPTRRDLLTHVWQMPYGGADKTVDVHISWPRRKLGETAQRPRYLHTVRGVGIKLSPPG